MRTIMPGGCLCGVVRFELTAPPLRFVACHCRDCQYVSGGGPAYVLVVARDVLRMVQGEETVSSYESVADSGKTVRREFCSVCGTPLFELLEMNPAIRLVKAGSLDDTTSLRVEAVAWAASAQAWSYVDRSIDVSDGNPTPRN